MPPSPVLGPWVPALPQTVGARALHLGKVSDHLSLAGTAIVKLLTESADLLLGAVANHLF